MLQHREFNYDCSEVQEKSWKRERGAGVKWGGFLSFSSLFLFLFLSS